MHIECLPGRSEKGLGPRSRMPCLAPVLAYLASLPACCAAVGPPAQALQLALELQTSSPGLLLGPELVAVVALLLLPALAHLLPARKFNVSAGCATGGSAAGVEADDESGRSASAHWAGGSGAAAAAAAGGASAACRRTKQDQTEP